jgi:hypothetical protein
MDVEPLHTKFLFALIDCVTRVQYSKTFGLGSLHENQQPDKIGQREVRRVLALKYGEIQEGARHAKTGKAP